MPVEQCMKIIMAGTIFIMMLLFISFICFMDNDKIFNKIIYFIGFLGIIWFGFIIYTILFSYGY